MERITGTIDEETLTAARERLGRLGVLKLLDDLDAKHGKPSARVAAHVAAKAGRAFRR